MANEPSSSAIFRTGSTTYFYASIFFPEDIRSDVFNLYAFVRTADDFVDTTPQKAKSFHEYVKEYHATRLGEKSSNTIIRKFVNLQEKYLIPDSWVDAFLKAMEQDLHKKEYLTIKETEQYMYGSAEVIGLMMAKIMGIPKEVYPAAQKLGKAMQFINFIRDVREDIDLGRTYLPSNDLREHGLKNLHEEEARKNPDNFREYITHQLIYYATWQKEAESGFPFIPRTYLIPIKTASDMYNWTAEQIEKNPFIIFEKKVKPKKTRILAQVLKNFLTL